MVEAEQKRIWTYTIDCRFWGYKDFMEFPLKGNIGKYIRISQQINEIELHFYCIFAHGSFI